VRPTPQFVNRTQSPLRVARGSYGNVAPIRTANWRVRFSASSSGSHLFMTVASCRCGCRDRLGKPSYSITSSARSRNGSGIVSPSVFAVRRLTISSNFVGCRIHRQTIVLALRPLREREAGSPLPSSLSSPLPDSHSQAFWSKIDVECLIVYQRLQRLFHSGLLFQMDLVHQRS